MIITTHSARVSAHRADTPIAQIEWPAVAAALQSCRWSAIVRDMESTLIEEWRQPVSMREVADYIARHGRLEPWGRREVRRLHLQGYAHWVDGATRLSAIHRRRCAGTV